MLHLTRCLLFVALASLGSLSAANDNLFVNGDFEQGLSGWSGFWSRTPGGRASVETSDPYAGEKSVRIEHTGSKDWSFGQQKPLRVHPGEIYELSGVIRVKGEGNATLGVILYDAAGKAIDWTFGGVTVVAADGWQKVHSRFLIPEGAATMLPRLIGFGPATVWLDDAELQQSGSLSKLRTPDLPAAFSISNSLLGVKVNGTDGRLTVTDKRSGRTWKQRSGTSAIVLDGQAEQRKIELRLLIPESMLEIDVRIELDEKRPEILVALDGRGPFHAPIAYPPTIATEPGMLLIMPVNEGISYPVDDRTLPPMHYYMYGGHGLCMGWWGITDGQGAMMTLVETPDDATVRISRNDGLLCPTQQWVPQKGQFGPERRVRYVFFDEGGYVAMCKRYRRYSQEIGLFKTLVEKRKSCPAVDRLVGAVNVWCWDRDAVGICRDLQAAGIKRILWSHRSEPEQIDALNEMGVLTSRYDIYQDVMNPANFKHLRGVHPDWTTEAWPEDLMIDANGQWVRGWRVKGKDGKWYPCGVLCDRLAPPFAVRRIGAELKTHAYRCRFIDTTTASPWRECYAPAHPMTRSDSRYWI